MDVAEKNNKDSPSLGSWLLKCRQLREGLALLVYECTMVAQHIESHDHRSKEELF